MSDTRPIPIINEPPQHQKGQQQQYQQHQKGQQQQYQQPRVDRNEIYQWVSVTTLPVEEAYQVVIPVNEFYYSDGTPVNRVMTPLAADRIVGYMWRESDGSTRLAHRQRNSGDFIYLTDQIDAYSRYISTLEKESKSKSRAGRTKVAEKVVMRYMPSPAFRIMLILSVILNFALIYIVTR